MKKIEIDHQVSGRVLQRETVRTHAEVGALLSISAEAVRVIEARALAKCRRRLLFELAKLRAANV